MHNQIRIFNFEIPGYSLMIFIGLIMMMAYIIYKLFEAKIIGHYYDRLLMIIVISGIMLFLSAMLFNDLWNYLKNGYWTSSTGLTFLGGFVGGLITFIILFWIIMKKERHNIFSYLDIIATGVVIAHAWGRIGCYMGGCCYGTETHSFIGIAFPEAGTTVIPTMLIESFFLFILFLIFHFVVRKNQFTYYLISYGTFRFLIEFLRGDNRGSSPIPGLSPSQFLSILIIILGFIILFWGEKLLKKLIPNKKIPV